MPETRHVLTQSLETLRAPPPPSDVIHRTPSDRLAGWLTEQYQENLRRPSSHHSSINGISRLPLGASQRGGTMSNQELVEEILETAD